MTKLHLIAKTVVINEEGKVLVLRRSPWPARPNLSHQPDFPGGTVEKDETSLEGAVREMEEEIGVVADPSEFELAFDRVDTYPDSGDEVRHWLYILRLDHTPEVKLSWEHETYEWLDAKDIVDNYGFSPFYTDVLPKLFDKKLI